MRALLAAGLGVAIGVLSAAEIATGASARAGDDGLAAVLALREAEVSSDAVALETQARSMPTQSAAAEFAALARQALAMRSAATTASALVSAEDGLERSRRSLAARFAASDPGLAREMLLQCAEDLLLRRLAADASDAMIAVGVPSETERATLRAVLGRADEALADPLLRQLFAPAAELATDPGVFRARLLAGLAAANRADLDGEPADGARRASAAALLSDAARSELRVPPSIAHALAFARARTAADAAARTRFLDEARDAGDPMLRFAVAAAAWRDGRADAAFPSAPSGDAMGATLAALAEWRARRERGQPPSLAARALAHAARTKGAVVAAAIAERLDAPARAAIAADAASPEIALALVSIHPDEAALLAARAPALVQLVRDDPAVRTWLALPLSRMLAATDRPREACEVLRGFIDVSHETPAGRAALDVALELARGTAARSAQGEVALEETLALAGRRYFADASYQGWMLERVDLALFPRWSAPDPALAARALAAVPADPGSRVARELRSAEIDAARAKRADSEAIAARAESLVREAASDADIAGRAQLVRATMLALAGRDADSLSAVDLVLASGARGARTPARAAALWIELASRSARRIDAPESLVALARTDSDVGTLVAEAIVARASAVAKALLEGGDAKEPQARLAALGPLGAAQDSLNAIAPREAMLLALASGRADDAVRTGEREPEPGRESRWLLAEALLLRGKGDDETHAFEILRGLSPMQSVERDPVWWCAQARQLEILVRKPGRAADIVARINRLSAIDAELGGKTIRKRLDSIRGTAEDALKERTR